ncbi:hypothetical protein SAMN05660903_00652 [Salegentibacter salinarum]|uniref:hypothetical protein n=1 Tax=Salegentibacter salinarum TaxID=447422 RepID=UPI0009C503F0|nr:hypothetical protein [Salegentibacter salinarum]SKB42472.1 hypothetical protein SAMN05660903_00652 [Salegentibacter salinarum]
MGKNFDKWNYIIDRWGLFNPPGIDYDDKDTDDDIPFDNPLGEDELNNLGKVGFAFYILLINKNPDETSSSGVREPVNISLLKKTCISRRSQYRCAHRDKRFAHFPKQKALKSGSLLTYSSYTAHLPQTSLWLFGQENKLW